MAPSDASPACASDRRRGLAPASNPAARAADPSLQERAPRPIPVPSQEFDDSDLYDVERNPLDALVLPAAILAILLAGGALLVWLL